MALQRDLSRLMLHLYRDVPLSTLHTPARLNAWVWGLRHLVHRGCERISRAITFSNVWRASVQASGPGVRAMKL